MLLAVAAMGLTLSVCAEEHGEQTEQKTVVELPQWMKNIRLSGYGMVQYQTTSSARTYSSVSSMPVSTTARATRKTIT